ncbi:MAG TPA: NTF2 fold immunity protein [Bacteroidia bacterium]|jgi:hypothetical protein|nr:NTF2 fold immunity protein [Bacteroidia bacterium]
MKTLLILILSLSVILTAIGQQSHIIKKDNSDSVINFYQSETSTYFFNDTLVNNEKTAIAEAEAILFNIYGKEQIESEKPYGVTYKNGCWFISGTLPQDAAGGVFSIVINAKDGKAVVFPHGK